MAEGRVRKREEGRRKKEEGRVRKREEEVVLLDPRNFSAFSDSDVTIESSITCSAVQLS